MSSRPRPSATRLLVAYGYFKGPKDSRVLRLVVDTGATTTVIPPKIAAALGCDPANSTRKVSIITASGTEYLPVVSIPVVACLGEAIRSLPVACHDLPPESTVDGLLGLDFLQHVPVFQQFYHRFCQLTHE